MNYICRRSDAYPVLRSPIPDYQVPWTVSMQSYKPSYYTSSKILKCHSADPEIGNDMFNPKWNDVDGSVDRRSFDNNKPFNYLVVQQYPLNPRGRTGLRGRGCLYRWGPNHARHDVTTRWKKSEDGEKVLNPLTNQPILQFLAVLRKDSGKYEIPGEFLDADQESSSATQREPVEEAKSMENVSEDDKKAVEEFFKYGIWVYKGYVDDPRNTDNAWIETTITNFHDDSGAITYSLTMDVDYVKWVDIDEHMDIYETHYDIIKSVKSFYLLDKKE